MPYLSVPRQRHAHNTLKWLIRRQQGRKIDDNTVFLTWGTGAETLPNLTDYDPEVNWCQRLPFHRSKHYSGSAVADGSHGFESRLLTELEEQARESGREVSTGSYCNGTRFNHRQRQGFHRILSGVDIPDYLNNLRYWYDSCKWPLSDGGR